MKHFDYDSLPDDEDAAFIVVVEELESGLQTSLSTAGNDGADALLVEHMNNVIAAAKALNISELSGWSVPAYEHFHETYSSFSLAVKGFIFQARIRKSRVNRIYSVALDENAKRIVHHHIERIRGIVQAADLDDRKRNSLFAKLNAFAADVDRARTPFQNAMLALSDLADVAKKGTEALKPITDLVNSITALLGEAKDKEPDTLKLPAPEDRKRIEGPKQAPSRELDDDIPF